MKRSMVNRVGSWRVRSPALFIPLLLAGCSAGIGHGCFLCGPFADSLRGSVTGLVGSGLTLQSNPAALARAY
jgi:hypothetical protein